MKLLELNPKFVQSEGVRSHLSFDCPVCKNHKIVVPIFSTPKAWSTNGDSFENITLNPSIAHDNGSGCKSHFFITNGEINLV